LENNLKSAGPRQIKGPWEESDVGEVGGLVRVIGRVKKGGERFPGPIAPKLPVNAKVKETKNGRLLSEQRSFA